MPSASAKHWCFTLNNPTDDELGHLAVLVTIGRLDYLCYGKETSESGTPHLQGHLYRKTKARLGWLKRHVSSRAHWEVSRNYSQSILYCRKGSQSHSEWNEAGVAGPNYGVDADVFEDGDSPPILGQRSDLESAAGLVLSGVAMCDIAAQHPVVFVKFNRGLAALQASLSSPVESTDVRGIWIYGAPGVGKSHAVRRHEDELYIKSQNKWFDGYSGQPAILIDDFDRGGKCLGHYLKLWADRWQVSGEIKGSTVALEHQRFYITSNYHPNEIWPDMDDIVLLEAIERRFNIIHKHTFEQELDLPDAGDTDETTQPTDAATTEET